MTLCNIFRSLPLRRLLLVASAIALSSACSDSEDASSPEVIDRFVAQVEEVNRQQAACNYEIDRDGDLIDDAVADKVLSDLISCLSAYQDAWANIEPPHEFREIHERIYDDTVALIDVDREIMDNVPESDADFERAIELLNESMDLYGGIMDSCREIELQTGRQDDLHCPALFEPLGPDHPNPPNQRD